MPPPAEPLATPTHSGRIRYITHISPVPLPPPPPPTSTAPPTQPTPPHSPSSSLPTAELPFAVSHRRSTLRSSSQRTLRKPQTPYNTTAYILSHPPPGARPASSPDRYGGEGLDMPEIDQWKGYGSMEKGVTRMLRGASGGDSGGGRGIQEERGGGEKEGRGQGEGEERKEEVKGGGEEGGVGDGAREAEGAEERERRRGRGRVGKGGRGRGRVRARGRGGRGRPSVRSQGTLRAGQLASGELSPALSGISGGGSPAHSVVNGDDIERWTRRQRERRAKAQERRRQGKGRKGGEEEKNGEDARWGEGAGDTAMQDADGPTERAEWMQEREG